MKLAKGSIRRAIILELVSTFSLSKKEREYIRYAIEFTLENEVTQSNTMNERRLGLENLLFDINSIEGEYYQKKTFHLNEQIKKNFQNEKFRYLKRLYSVSQIKKYLQSFSFPAIQ
jgi:hypothetical protein